MYILWWIRYVIALVFITVSSHQLQVHRHISARLLSWQPALQRQHSIQEVSVYTISLVWYASTLSTTAAVLKLMKMFFLATHWHWRDVPADTSYLRRFLCWYMKLINDFHFMCGKVSLVTVIQCRSDGWRRCGRLMDKSNLLGIVEEKVVSCAVALVAQPLITPTHSRHSPTRPSGYLISVKFDILTRPSLWGWMQFSINRIKHAWSR